MKRIFLTLILILSFVLPVKSQMLQSVVTGKTTSPTITYDTSSSNSNPWGTTVSWSHTLTAEANSIVIVHFTANDADVVLDGCNWDQGGTPVAMTALTEHNYTTEVSSRIFYILSPAVTGTATIQCTSSASATLIGTAISIYGATETGSGTTNEAGTTAHATSISDTLTTGINNSWVVTGAIHRQNEAMFTTQGETKRVELLTAAGSDSGNAIATKEIATAGANTFGWSAATSNYWVMGMAEFKPVP